MDPKRAENIDAKNRNRIIRSIEIARQLGEVPVLEKRPSHYDFEIIYLDKPDEELKERIEKRLLSRLDAGMIEEVERLHDEGVNWDKLESFGLEYKYIAEFLQGKFSEEGDLSCQKGADDRAPKNKNLAIREEAADLV